MFEQLLGQTLGRYRIDSLIGEGGMGAVYQGFDETLQRSVAVKVLSPQYIRQPNFRDRFLQEARTAARLRHPGIVQVHDFGQAPQLLFIVMEFIPGDNLEQLMKALRADGKRLLLSESAQIVQRVCEAVGYAHRHGILHRDIKPSNIMLRDEPSDELPFQPILTDLGLAKLAEGGVVTQVGTSMGTPAYMSPEQALGETTDTRSDVYSLGILLYELCVGHPPFPVKSITEAIRYHTRETPPSLIQLRSDVPASLENAVLKSLEKPPDRRFKDAGTFADALSELWQELRTQEQGPTRAGQAVSLLTQFQPSLERAYKRPARDFPVSPPAMAQDRILVLLPNQATRTILLDATAMTVGRDASNDVVLDQPKVSRRHARIERNGPRYTVTDLNSTNGTYLDDAKLLPDIPEVWSSGSLLRIGDNFLRLESAADLTGAAPTPSEQTAIDTGVIGTSPRGGQVGLFLESNRLTVEPDTVLTVNITLFNQGRLVDHLEIGAEGIPSDWIASTPPPVHLMPGQQKTVTVTIRPPRSTSGLAGEHSVIFTASSQAQPGQVARLQATLIVGTFKRFTVDIRPRQQTRITEAEYRLLIRNEGNASLDLELDAISRDESCDFAFARPHLTLPPGEESSVPMKVSSRIPLAVDDARRHSFTVFFRPQNSPELVQQVNGVWEQRKPTLEVELRPHRQRGTALGQYVLSVKNLSNEPLNVMLEALEPAGACVIELDVERLMLEPGQEQLGTIRISSKQPLEGQAPLAHHFTVTARPEKAPASFRQVEGEWEQVPPDFSIQIQPEKATASQAAHFKLMLSNQSDATLSIRLEAQNVQGLADLQVDPTTVRLQPGSRSEARIVARSRSPLPGDSARSIFFSVTARPDEAPGVVRQTQGEWIQQPPAFELEVAPRAVASRKRADFQVTIDNRDDSDLEIELEATDPDSHCLFDFRPASFTVRAGRRRSVQLMVQSKAPQKGKEPHAHSFTVTARATQAPAVLRQTVASWEQHPGGRSASLSILLSLIAWVFVIGGWAAGYFAWAIARGIIFDPIFFSLVDIGLFEYLAARLSYATSGAVAAVIGGFATWLSARIVEPSVSRISVVATVLYWLLAFGLSLIAPVLIPDLEVPVEALAVAVLAGAATWLLLRSTDLTFGAASVFLAMIGWGVGYAAGMGGGYLGLYPESPFSALVAGAMFGAVGGLVMLWRIGRARRQLD